MHVFTSPAARDANRMQAGRTPASGLGTFCTSCLFGAAVSKQSSTPAFCPAQALEGSADAIFLFRA
ncbi:hypothetical protein COCVIDRAFT_107481 [Bipolaris victoriae FI3]|uniref:Uncharacterized protein n=1 Tax=Bipolaris victoriae (strain FI3) TaxID=930091 RepID=W7EA64_BIPV3|nr:hypothetical protein COCVIDRAFT_107481 [Bipolaris victoriae FI3]